MSVYWIIGTRTGQIASKLASLSMTCNHQQLCLISLSCCSVWRKVGSNTFEANSLFGNFLFLSFFSPKIEKKGGERASAVPKKLCEECQIESQGYFDATSTKLWMSDVEVLGVLETDATSTHTLPYTHPHATSTHLPTWTPTHAHTLFWLQTKNRKCRKRIKKIMIWNSIC